MFEAPIHPTLTQTHTHTHTHKLSLPCSRLKSRPQGEYEKEWGCHGGEMGVGGPTRYPSTQRGSNLRFLFHSEE